MRRAALQTGTQMSKTQQLSPVPTPLQPQALPPPRGCRRFNYAHQVVTQPTIPPPEGPDSAFCCCGQLRSLGTYASHHRMHAGSYLSLVHMQGSATRLLQPPSAAAASRRHALLLTRCCGSCDALVDMPATRRMHAGSYLSLVHMQGSATRLLQPPSSRRRHAAAAAAA